MTIAVLVLIALLALAIAATLRAYSPRRRADRDAEHAAARIAAIAAMPEPDELPRARDLTRAERRRLRWRSHPIARKRSGRPI
jgi:cbb3-type cytochrome oxidase subunit 3